MALFTDGPVAQIDDLVDYESSILDVARTEGIDLTRKLELGHEELAIELEALLAKQAASQAIGTVVVTDALHKWHTFRSLALVYRDAFNRQLNDRYLGKWREYQRLARWALEALLQKGLGITDRPIPRPAKPELGGAPAGGVAGATYYVEIAWLTAVGEESSPSEPAAITLAGGSALVVTPPAAPPNVSGWNLYIGYDYSDLQRQNTAPLAAGQSWTLPASGLRDGAAPGAGQPPVRYLRPTNVWSRG